MVKKFLQPVDAKVDDQAIERIRRSHSDCIKELQRAIAALRAQVDELSEDDGGGVVTDHGALDGLADDDHPQYQKESERSAANGYASLDASALVPTDELGTGSASDETFLRGDQTWVEGPDVPSRSMFGPWTVTNLVNTSNVFNQSGVLIATTITNLNAGNEIEMPVGGYVAGVAFSIRGVSAGNDGKLSVKATIDGSVVGTAAEWEVDNGTNIEYWGRSSFTPVAFSAGDRLGIKYATTSNSLGNGWNATNADAIIWLLIIL